MWGRRGVNGDKVRLGDEENVDEGVLACKASSAELWISCTFLFMLKLDC